MWAVVFNACVVFTFSFHDPKEPVLLIALKIMRHAKLCLSVIMFLTFINI